MRENYEHDELTWRDNTILARPLDHFDNNARAYTVIAFTTAIGGAIGYFLDSPLIGAGIGATASSGLAILANKTQ